MTKELSLGLQIASVKLRTPTNFYFGLFSELDESTLWITLSTNRVELK